MKCPAAVCKLPNLFLYIVLLFIIEVILITLDAIYDSNG